MKKIFFLITCTLVCIVIFMGSCSDSFLDMEPNKKIVVPSTLEDVRSLLNNNSRMNMNYTGTQEVITDDYFLTDDGYGVVATMTTGLSYIWETDVLISEINDWSVSYANVFYCNVALETLELIKKDETDIGEWNNLKGQALFFRSLNFYSLIQLFAKPFRVGAEGTDPGIVLKLSADINEKVKRATVKECYDQILADLTEASQLLSKNQKYKTLPDECAAHALLARIYLSIADYRNAMDHAQKALGMTEGLMDYNELSSASLYPFDRFNQEVIFHCTTFDQPKSLSRVSPDLYAMYASSDLRRSLLYDVSTAPLAFSFKGSYDGDLGYFVGMAADELCLIIAECYARSNELEKATYMLNDLLKKRWDNSMEFIPIENRGNILDLILDERRKELPFRGVRWSDLRRYVLEGRSIGKIVRTIKGKTYELKPERISSYVLKIPYQVIINNGMEQNE
ncbi:MULTISPECIES: RagB/SusD family nutrient uptake outer membrane protein [Sphingobacterium]|uniref:RagB/SusD family nutrient uptake outer membrane protein n=1 Tax=Sphingobacterium TaxID=28453 RepID=UPI00257C9CC3|nr:MULTISPECIES: RagB/SusD family nutrient uptake outer membrane protein [Sphingobacterium]